jgi:DNA invertase Pin-like site-specific DNA recombinase
MSSKPLIPGAGYIRNSSKKQKDSPERQRRAIEELAARDGYRIVEWYADRARTGTESSKRLDFQRLLKDAQSGKFKAVLMSEGSRMSREDVLDVVEHWKKFQRAGVTLVTCQRGIIDTNSLPGLLMAIIDAHGANDESRKLADRATGGLRLAVEQRNQRLGAVPYAYDREIIDETGKVVRTVSFRELFAKPKGWRTRLIPSRETAAVEAVRFMFAKVLAGWTVRQIVKALNAGGVLPRETRDENGKPRRCVWTVFLVNKMLRNPVYCGDYVMGRRPRGKFCRVVETPTVKMDAHPAIIEREQFQAVQRILTLRYKPRGAAVPGRNLFAGIGRCAHCGKALATKNGPGDHRAYICCGWGHSPGADNCPHPSVQCRYLESAILQLVQRALRGETTRQQLAKAARRTGRPAGVDATTTKRRRLAELDQLIERATQNIVLAEDPGAIRRGNEMIAEWRKEQRDLERALGLAESVAAASPEAVQTIKDFDGNLATISRVQRSSLALALSLTLKAVRIGNADKLEGRNRRIYATVEFLPGVCDVTGELRIDHEDIVPPRRWQKATAHINENFGRTFSRLELCRLFKANSTQMARELAAAEAFGQIRRVGPFEYTGIAPPDGRNGQKAH